MFLEFFFPDMTLRNDLQLHHAFHKYFYYFSTNPKRYLGSQQYYIFYFIYCFVFTCNITMQTVLHYCSLCNSIVLILALEQNILLNIYMGCKSNQQPYSTAGGLQLNGFKCKPSLYAMVEIGRQNLMANFSVLFVYIKVFY